MAKLKREQPGPDVSSDKQTARAREVGTALDPRWALTGRPKLRPAMAYLLMTGESTNIRLRGWVALEQAGQFGEPMPEAVWEAYGNELMAEAAASNFTPFWLHKKKPKGAAFEQWRTSFLAAHRY